MYLGEAFEHAVPVELGKDVALEDPHGIPLLGLIKGKCLTGISIVVELGEEHSSTAGDDRAGGVAVVTR